MGMKSATRSMLGTLTKKPAPENIDQPAAAVSTIKVIDRLTQVPQDKDAVILRCDYVVVKEQARKSFDSEKLKELAENIAVQGQQQPIIIWINEREEYQLVAGERRLRAIRDILKRKEIKATICRSLKNADEIAAAQLSENIQREPYKAVELAHEFERLKNTYGYTNVQLGKKVGGLAESTVSRFLSLLSAPSDVIAAIENGNLAPTFYFNNKVLFEHGLPDGLVPGGALRALDKPAGQGRAVTKPGNPPVQGGSMVSIPETSARALFEVLQEMAKRLKMKPIEPVGDLNKKELKGLLTRHAVAVSRKLRA
jgi:ParB/RepB/Spo0J family partition protein